MRYYFIALCVGLLLGYLCGSPFLPQCWAGKDLSPGFAVDCIKTLGPMLSWLPLHYLMGGASYPATRRALFLSVLGWLCFVWVFRLTKDVAHALGQPRKQAFDPSGHIFLFGMHILPASVFIRECRSCQAPAAGGSWLPWSAILGRAAPAQLLCCCMYYLGACTAAFYHGAAEVWVAYAVVLGLHLLARRSSEAPEQQGAGRWWWLASSEGRKGALACAACAWALCLLSMLLLIASRGERGRDPLKGPWKVKVPAFHDLLLLSLAAGGLT
jgi:hypothetical protein